MSQTEAKKKEIKCGVQGKVVSPFIFEHNPYRNTWEFDPLFLETLEESNDVRMTIKLHGECYWLDSEGQWWSRRDLRVHNKFRKVKAQGKLAPKHFEETLTIQKAKNPAMKDWIPCGSPDLPGGHWFGWLPVTSEPKHFKYALEAIKEKNFLTSQEDNQPALNQTYELIGPKVQGNVYGLASHVLVEHGVFEFKSFSLASFMTPTEIHKLFLGSPEVLRSEGVVIWLDGRPVWKIHHGHIHDGDDEKSKVWEANPLIPAGLSIFQKKNLN